MREIKFRAKRLEDNKFVTGSLMKYFDIYPHDDSKIVYYIMNLGGGHAKVDPETIGQYTGLKDKNGKEIFEGDIVKLENGFWGGLYNYVEIQEDEYCAVYYDEKYARYDLQTKDNDTEFKRVVWHQLVNGEIEIIGSIYDNPELVEKVE